MKALNFEQRRVQLSNCFRKLIAMRNVMGCDPLSSARRHVQITDCGLDVRRNAVPIELWIPIHDICGES